jgi:hypothetical protein
MSGANQYETLYGVGLLDDLHNYFPAVLYDSGRFRTTGELLHYITTCVRNRFDLFSFGQRSYLNTTLESSSSHPNSVSPAQGPQASNAFPQPQAPVDTNIPEEASAPRLRTRRMAAGEPHIETHIEILQEDLGLDNQALSLLNLMNLLSGIPAIPRRQPNLPNSFLEPVVVRPTPEQIESGSTRAFPAEEMTCAICQDAIPVNQMARRLNVCGHTFHISCIDQWFGRDVRCPTCRHDIREPAASSAQESSQEV